MTDQDQPPVEPIVVTARRADTFGAHVLAFFAGMIGGLAFCQLPSGGVIGVILGYASTIPLFLSGLTGGRNVSISACAFAVIAVFLRLGGPAAALFAILFAMPVMVLTRVALINFGSYEQPRYINSSAVLLTAMALGTLLMSVAATSLAVYDDGIANAVTQVVDSYKTLLSQNATAPELTPEKLDQAFSFMRTAIPSMVLMSWFFILALAGTAAQYIAVEMKQNLRPSIKLKEITLPLWLAGLFIVCFIGSLLATSPDLAMVLSAFSTLYAVGFILSGMAEMHRRIDTRAERDKWSAGQRKALYIFIYAAALILQVPVFIMLLIGLIAPFTFWRLKQRTVTPDGQ